MTLIDKLLQYYETKDRKILITTDLQISNADLHGVVVKILSWLRLEYKRTLWIDEGRKTCLKPLDIDIRYPWCPSTRSSARSNSVYGTWATTDRKSVV